METESRPLSMRIVYVIFGIFLIIESFISIVVCVTHAIWFIIFCFIQSGIGIYMIYREVGINKMTKEFERQTIEPDMSDVASFKR